MTGIRFAAYSALLCTLLIFAFHTRLYEWANANMWVTVPSALLILIALERIVPGIEDVEAHLDR